MRIIVKYIITIITCTVLCAQQSKAGVICTKESELIGHILACMQYKDTISYAALFPTFDTLWQQIMEYSGGAADAEAINHIRQHPEKVRQFDPALNPAIIYNYYNVLKKGEDSGINWDRIVLERFVLQRMPLTRDIVGYEKIAVNRFQGFVFIKDMLTRHIYAFTVKEMQNINGLWYGGQVMNLFEASTVEEYEEKLAGEIRRQRLLAALGLTERDMALLDSARQHGIKTDSVADDYERSKEKGIDDDTHVAGGLQQREVVDRKFFGGTFDNEIPVKLYIRYLKGNCPAGICAWEAIYKFGTQQEYIKLDVSKTPDGHWLFSEDPPIGSMDLVYKNGGFTGNWESTSEEKTGYDVRLSPLELTPEKARELDRVFEENQFAKGLNEQEEEARKKKAEKEKEEEEQQNRY